MSKELTGAVDEKDGTLVVKGDDGKSIRYVKESDLLAVKGSKENTEKAIAEAGTARDAAIAEANERVEAEHQKVLQAEARISSLQEQVATGMGGAAELTKAKAELEAAKKSGVELSNKFLELRRSVVMQTYNIPKETVDSKDLAALEVFEEALKSVLGSKGVGNYAFGGGGGGASALTGKSPMELAQEAYSQSK